MWLLVVAASLHFGVPAGEAYLRYLEYKDAMKQELRFRANRSNDKIRADLRAMADSLGLPADAGNVDVHRDGAVVSVSAEYDEVLQFPGFRKPVHFSASAADTY